MEINSVHYIDSKWLFMENTESQLEYYDMHAGHVIKMNDEGSPKKFF